MNRIQLEHIIRAASQISDDSEIVVIGSQAILPAGWEQRLIRVAGLITAGATGFCLDAHDLMLSKYTAGREKDLEFNHALVR